MQLLCDDETQVLTGGFRIVVSPTIAISPAVVTGLQGTNGTSIGLGVFGAGTSGLAQFSALGLSTYLANLSF
ncbi:hypothetical protein NZK27_01505 [Synechococcus sp. FGCU-3]|jgi:hypothetical protein|nr:hypothetical protein [Synechococcus sp. FGCU3]